VGVWDGAWEEEEYEGEINVDTLEILLRHCLLHFWVYVWSSGWTGHLGHGVGI
jgi:SHS2 domain-containing protein